MEHSHQSCLSRLAIHYLLHGDITKRSPTLSDRDISILTKLPNYNEFPLNSNPIAIQCNIESCLPNPI